LRASGNQDIFHGSIEVFLATGLKSCLDRVPQLLFGWRSTFPSAILNALVLRNETAATLIGEPTAGKPNHFGEVRTLELPNSAIKVSYSTKYFRDSDDDSPSLRPDILVEQTSADYLVGHDPVLDAIISSPRR
jgi:hypothetical protein